jgi:hypothetical protein
MLLLMKNFQMDVQGFLLPEDVGNGNFSSHKQNQRKIYAAASCSPQKKFEYIHMNLKGVIW